MKVLHITPSYKPAFVYGGPTVSISQLCENQVSLGHVIQVLTTTAGGKEELNVEVNRETIVDGVNVIYFKRWTKDHSHFSPSLILKLNKIAHDYDVIHIHSWWNLVSLLSTIICFMKGIKPVLSPRGMLTSSGLGFRQSALKNIFHLTIGKLLLKKTFLHATSLLEEVECKTFIPNWKSITLPNIIHLPDQEAFHEVANSEYKLLFFSRINPIKGIENLFYALQELKLNLKLTIAGTGEAKYIESLNNLAKILKIDDKINWIGWVGSKDKYNVLRHHDLLILPSFTENFANVVVESLYVGTPVLISENVGLSNYVKEKNFGWVTKLDVSEIQKNLYVALTAHQLREEIRINAPITIEKDFDSKRIADKYMQFYKSVKNNKVHQKIIFNVPRV